MRKLFYVLVVLALCLPVFTLAKPVRADYEGEDPYTVGGDTVVVFLQSGVFTVPSGVFTVAVLVVAGAGGGGRGHYVGTTNVGHGGGGGAGGLIYVAEYDISEKGSPITVTVGTGGAGATDKMVKGVNGNNSVFAGLTAVGGGGGGSSWDENGNNGGSGGGGGRRRHGDSLPLGTGGSSTQPSENDGYAGTGFGNAGATAASGNPGGGGGAGSAGAVSGGGSGKAYSITGASVTYAVGGTAKLTTQVHGGANTGKGGGGSYNVNGGNGGSGIVIIRYSIALAVSSHSATSITVESASLHGEVTEIAGSEIVERGFVWDEISRGDPGDVDISATDYADYWSEVGSWGLGTFSRTITGLTSDTTYYFRAAAKNDNDAWAYGDELGFTTPGAPVVVTLTAIETKDTSALLRGQVTDVNDTEILERGFDWGTSSGTYPYSETQTGSWLTGPFSIYVAGLSKGVTHYYRAKARNVFGWGYGDEFTFATFNPSIYASCIDDDDSDAEIYGPNWYAQTFTPYEGFKLAAVRIKAAAVNITGPLTVSIRETTDLGVIRTLDLVSTVYDGLGSLDWYEIPMPEYYLENKEYALVIRAVAGDAANYVQWRYASNSTCSGCYASSVNSGTSWTHNCDRSFMYEIRGHTTLKILNAQVFTGYLEEGDWLIAVYYLNEYPPYYGTTVMSDYFALQLMVGGLPVVSTRLRQWGQMPGSLYIGKTLAETLSWGETYQIRMIGLFDPYPFTAYTLIPPDWKGFDLKRLDSWVIETAKSISIKYETALVTVANKDEVLNELGSVLFKVGVPMLEQVRPHLFLFPDVRTPYSERKWTRAYEDSFDYTELWGDKILDDAAAVGGMFGIEGLEVLRLVFFGTWAVVGVGAVAVVGTGAIFVSMPFLIIGTLSGVLPITPLALVVALIVMTLVYVIWFRGT